MGTLRSGRSGEGVSLIGLQAAVYNAVASVHDPEYPGISIVDLGLVENVSTTDTDAASPAMGQVMATIGLVPTFSGCPALAVIATDVHRAVEAVDGVGAVSVEWLRVPVWTPDRVTDAGRAALAEDFTVAVAIGSAEPACPRCGGSTTEQSMFGPSRCRSVRRCQHCSENLEVMRV